MIKKINNQKGFTIIELLLYMGIFSILMFVLFQLLISIFDVQLESQSTASVSRDGRYILNKLSYDIQKATSITTPAIGGQSQTLVFSDSVKIYTYVISNGNLNLTTNPGTTDQLNSFDTTVSNLNFLRLADSVSENDSVTVSFTLTSKVLRRGGTSSASLQTTIGTR